MLSDLASALLRGWLYTFQWEVRINYFRRGANIHLNMSIMALNHSELLCGIGVFFEKGRKEHAMFKIGVKLFPVCV